MDTGLDGPPTRLLAEVAGEVVAALLGAVVVGVTEGALDDPEDPDVGELVGLPVGLLLVGGVPDGVVELGEDVGVPDPDPEGFDPEPDPDPEPGAELDGGTGVVPVPRTTTVEPPGSNRTCASQAVAGADAWSTLIVTLCCVPGRTTPEALLRLRYGASAVAVQATGPAPESHSVTVTWPGSADRWSTATFRCPAAPLPDPGLAGDAPDGGAVVTTAATICADTCPAFPDCVPAGPCPATGIGDPCWPDVGSGASGA